MHTEVTSNDSGVIIMRNHFKILWAIPLFILALPQEAVSRDKVEGPYLGKIVEIVDSDTVKAKIRVWLDQYIEQTIRIKGIYTPEMNSKCAKEKHTASKAMRKLEDLTKGHNVLIRNIEDGKYGSRIVADLHTRAGKISKLMIDSNLARPYQEGQKQTWCDQRVSTNMNDS